MSFAVFTTDSGVPVLCGRGHEQGLHAAAYAASLLTAWATKPAALSLLRQECWSR
jgi:hypothetical protein